MGLRCAVAVLMFCTMNAAGSNRVELRHVQLATLECCGEGLKPFARRRGESQRAMRARLLAMDGLLARGKGRVAALERATACGQALPPVFVIAQEGRQPFLDDGCHRSTVAAMLGKRTISAVVFNTRSHQESDMVSQSLYTLEDAGVSWRERVRIVGAMLGA